jgi:mono/diheme cytochrome c family protein
MKLRITLSALLSAGALLAQAAGAAESAAGTQASIERGRYLVIVGDCNGCHTPGFPESGGRIAQEQWLTGSHVGFRGPWGTSYPTNLRLAAQAMTEAQWMARVRQPMRPPMPWYSLRDMSDADVAAVYRFIRSLGPAGEPAPRAAAPGERVSTPYFDFVPKNLPQRASR